MRTIFKRYILSVIFPVFGGRCISFGGSFGCGNVGEYYGDDIKLETRRCASPLVEGICM